MYVLNQGVPFCMLLIVLLKTIEVPKFEYEFIHVFKGVAHLSMSKHIPSSSLECQRKDNSDN